MNTIKLISKEFNMTITVTFGANTTLANMNGKRHRLPNEQEGWLVINSALELGFERVW